MRKNKRAFIEVKGARVHNLKSVDMLIPKNKMVVFTGVSGSGKSSLLFSTIYEEARARYLEALLPNAFRTFRLKRPDVDYIHGLLPPIAIEQKTTANLNPRSTVGTSTEVLTFLRMLFARIGQLPRSGDEQLTPAMFSFNTPYGMCERCSGLGEVMGFDIDLIIPDRKRSMKEILAKAIRGTFTPLEKSIEALAKQESFSLDTPFASLQKEAQHWLLWGYEKEIVVDYVFKTSTARRLKRYPGVVPFLEESYKETTSLDRRKRIEEYMSFSPCPVCRGARLNERALSVRVCGKSIDDMASMPVDELLSFFVSLRLEGEKSRLARELIQEVVNRLAPIKDVGLGYLTLKRSSPTLSVGESQRLSLARHLGSGLGGLLYILDEPTIGLHEIEKSSLMKSLFRLRDLGNSILVVEHDETVIRNADYIIDLGPGAGHRGGNVVACGTPNQISKSRASITGQYLRAPNIFAPERRQSSKGLHIKLLGAAENNLKNIDVTIPLGLFVCITGVSGSGKSSLVQETLYPALERSLFGRRAKVGRHKDLLGAENIDKVVSIDQSPIGRSPRSNPASYIGVWDLIRSFYARLPQARNLGMAKGAFSFNTDEQRCDRCKGAGVIQVDAVFLADLETVCPECDGSRYKEAVLSVTYKGKSIGDVLDLTFEQASEFFSEQKEIVSIIRSVEELGLGYLKMGQPATTLAGGEAQRIKLIYELKKRATGNTLYILDEPTTGLHFADVDKLLRILHRLVEVGNSVLVIEHNMSVIRTADYIIDLGPGGGDKGGEVIACGTPEAVAASRASLTGRFLKKGELH